MADGGFVVTGTRAPSATKHGYHIIAAKSLVDESLFRSQHNTRLDDTIINFKAPWEYPKPEPPSQTFGTINNKIERKSKPQGRPLLWCPTPGCATHTRQKVHTKSSLDDTDCLWSTRDNFRHLKHTPSFVDESLFGPRLKEPAFEAPWNFVKNGGNQNSKLYTLNNSARNDASPLTAAQTTKRPSTASGIVRREGKNKYITQITKPVWKP